MERLLVEFILRSTVVAAAIAIVLKIARIRTPAVVHGTWTSVVITMLLLPLWAAWGPTASIPVFPLREASVSVDIGTPAIAAEVADAAQSGPSSVVDSQVGAPRAPGAGVWSWRTVALVIYGLIAGVLLARLAAGTLRARALIRGSVLRDGRRTNAACASPVTVGWFRPVVILPREWKQWPQAKLDAVLAHEEQHARRRDPLVQWLVLLNRALFWFHPLAWWLERRLAALAEQACDDAVLGQGHGAHAYAEYLLEIARAAGNQTRARLAGVFMPGAYLPQRIRRIVEGPATPHVSRSRLTCAAAACAIASTAGIVGTPVRAASQQSGNPARMVIRPVQPRWISPDSTLPQPVSLEWLDGDEWAFQVQPIIRDDELVAYSRLETPQQRDAFIARFWGDRDPTPGTPANEFQAEYTRRLQFAIDRFAASGQGGFGFDTDRGRVHLMFGSPDAIDRDDAGSDPSEVWRYSAVGDIGSDLRIRFSLARDAYCGYRIQSPSPLSRIEAAASTASTDEPMEHAFVQIYPFGVTTISVPLDAARVVGARYELLDGEGVQVDAGQIGWVEGGTSNGPLSEHLPASWLATGLGCTHALPADSYTLSTAVRFVTGALHTETVAFEVQ